MLLQTNSYIVPKDKRAEHSRLVQRFRQCLNRLGCEHFETYEQVGANWSGGETTGRFVQLMRFRDRKHQLTVQAAERNDPVAQALIKEFCELINFPYQQQQGLFAVGFYQGICPTPAGRQPPVVTIPEPATAAEAGFGQPEDQAPAVPIVRTEVEIPTIHGDTSAETPAARLDDAAHSDSGGNGDTLPHTHDQTPQTEHAAPLDFADDASSKPDERPIRSQ
ncbi:MAG: hypothetical protein ACREJC_11240 [Tepidisphaeraceae bacterium]